jgi:hypothetical protein
VKPVKTDVTYVRVRVYEEKSSPLRQPRRRAQPDVGCLKGEDLSSYTLTNLECNLIFQHFDWSNSPRDTIVSVFTVKTDTGVSS